MRNLTVSRMMRADVRTVSSGQSLETFRKQFPLGSTQRVIVVDDEGRYAGIVVVADAYALNVSGGDVARMTLARLARHPGVALVPSMNVTDAAKMFEVTNSEELAVVDSPKTLKVVGLLTEQHLLRRYAEELDKARRDLAGEP